MYKAVTHIVTDAGEIPTGTSFVPEDYQLPLDEVERLVSIGSVSKAEPDPVDDVEDEESAVAANDRTKSSRKRTK